MEKFNGAKPLKAISKVRAYEKALLEMRGRMDGRIKSLATAWPKFNDATLNGLEWNTLTVVGARPGVGKTLFMEQLVTEVIALNQDQDFQVLQFQFEMPEKTLGMRAFSAITQKDYGVLHSKDEPLQEDIYNKCKQYTSTLNKNNKVFSIYRPCTVNEFCASIDYHFKTNVKEVNGTKVYPKLLVTVDHSALFKRDKHEKDRFEMLYNLGEALTFMKRTYPLSFVILSQLNRNIDDPKRAVEGTYGNYVLDSDLFGADALLQHADIVLGINKPAARKIRYYGPERIQITDPETLVFHFLKCRNGDTRISFFRLDRDTIRIVEMNTPTQNNKIQI